MSNRRPHKTISASDEETLTSGLFSDVTIKCADKTWALHLIILTTRCEFFRKALEADRFKESKEKHVEIHEQDPVQVYWVIFFLYTGRAPSDLLALLEDDETVMESCVDLFKIADFFTVDALCTHAVDVFLEHIVKHAKRTQSIIKLWGQNPTVDECLDLRFIDRFFQVTSIVYSSGLPSFNRLKRPLLMYPSLTRYVVMRTIPFKQRLLGDRELSEFAQDNLAFMFNTDMTKRDAYIPPKCFTCRTPTDFISGGSPEENKRQKTS
ncbi:hypothetical protein E0Z10_g10060 [Xylaria hypoxylon]|uniref:BTB domain-containing protein n=1 Tax=Xylaria hypoxylon TaxID=37992 RepID=A0A4Z0YQ33_9PEZI|nr:hypothetical protein E0Z10_g10060 [Xylaria hypoxylon]